MYKTALDFITNTIIFTSFIKMIYLSLKF